MARGPRALTLDLLPWLDHTLYYPRLFRRRHFHGLHDASCPDAIYQAIRIRSYVDGYRAGDPDRTRANPSARRREFDHHPCHCERQIRGRRNRFISLRFYYAVYASFARFMARISTLASFCIRGLVRRQESIADNGSRTPCKAQATFLEARGRECNN